MSDTREIGGGLERLGMVVVLPILIVVAAAGATYRTTPVAPIEYRATTVITPPTTVEESAAAVNLFITDLSELITTDATVAYVLSHVPGLDARNVPRSDRCLRRGTTTSVALSFVHAG